MHATSIKRFFKGSCLAACALAMLPMAPARADAPPMPDLRPVARQLAKEYDPALLTVRVVMSVGRGGNSQELKAESNATVLQPDGLAVVSLSGVDPISMYRQMNGGGDSEGGSYESRVKDLKYILPDKKEIAATIVLRDRDLNIAFLRPVKKLDQPMKFVDLSKATAAELLDPIILIARLGPIADRQISAQTGIIEGIVNKPRHFYVPGGMGLNGLAVPAFSAEGKVIGLIVLRTQSGGDDSFSMVGEGNSKIVPIILPASDVAEVAAQAPQEGEKIGAAAPAAAEGSAKPAGPAKKEETKEEKKNDAPKESAP